MKYLIEENQRALVYKNGIMHTILAPWKHYFSNMFSEYKVEIFDINLDEPTFRLLEKGNIFSLKDPKMLNDFFYQFELKDSEVWIVFRNKNIHWVLRWGETYLYWKGFWEYTCDTIDIKEDPQIDIKKYKKIKNVLRSWDNIIEHYSVDSSEKAVLEVDGAIKYILDAWEYLFSKTYHEIQIKRYDIRLQNLDVSGQEILTKDKISIRMNISVNFMIDNIEIFHSKFTQGYDYIYQKAQFIIRELASAKKLDELLEWKNEVSKELAQLLTDALNESGLKIDFVWIKDIILPWDMRDIMNQVIEAEKKSQINVIKRRDETATTRSLLNTAKLLEDNPLLLRLKELETLENIIDKVWSVNVSNWVDGLLKDFVKIWNA